MFDGEVCAVDAEGRTRFQDPQSALTSGKKDHLVYFIFDILFLDGFDLRSRPLAVRKAILESVLDGVKAPLAYVPHLESATEAKAVFAEACRRDLEGIVAKRLDRPYRAGRGPDWVKVKCRKSQEFVIVGYTSPDGGRVGFGALLLGVRGRDGGRLRYAGKVGTGFSDATRRTLAKELARTEVASPRFEGAPRMRDAVWVAPSRVCEVAFSCSGRATARCATRASSACAKTRGRATRSSKSPAPPSARPAARSR